MQIEYVNDVHMKVRCDLGTAQELSEYFTFDVPGAQFMPQVRNRFWDGKIRLYNSSTGNLYAGLLPYVQQFAAERDLDFEVDDPRFNGVEFTIADAERHLGGLGLPFKPRDYQVEAFTHAVRNKRALLLSPTASGKSLIIYALARYFWNVGQVLIVVPTVGLVQQMKSDFLEYGLPQGMIQTISAGEDKNVTAPITISTWQSIYKQPKGWFKRFKTVLGDEAHLYKAKSLTSLMSKLIDCPNRIGFTGTLDGTQTHKLVLEGLFGSVKKVTTTKELIDSETLADFKIKAIILNHNMLAKEFHKKDKYQDEVDFLVGNPARNRFIKNLAYGLKGNTLLLYQFVEKHGKVLFKLIEDEKNLINDKPTFLVHGGVEAEERERIRGIVEQETDSLIVASYGTFSTGINIRNLDNVIFASPSKSKIRVLQSIGRGLRRSDRKEKATLYDIGDDLTWKSRKNYTLEHFAERIKIYNEEKFDYKIYKVNLND